MTRKRVRLKKPVKRFLIVFAFFVVTLSIYSFGIGKVNNNNNIVEFTISEGNTFSSISKSLKDKKLIKSEFFYKLYLKLHHPKGLKLGTYQLKSNMNVKEIITTLEGDAPYNKNFISITFKEGINMNKIINLIADKTNNSEKDIKTILSDEDYLNSLIDKYWFLTEDIKQEGIYYSLEGYLYPDTYEFHVNGSPEDIFEAMLDNMDQKLSKYKTDIENSEYSVHEIMTLASIVELEASNSDDRAGVSGVFYNRLRRNWALGSDVTTYYAIQVDMNERDLYQSELDAYNPYNTRSSKMAGKLPIGPICIPSLESIVAAINPTEHNYLYFVADKNKKTYFSKTSTEHTGIVSDLKEKNLWYEY